MFNTETKRVMIWDKDQNKLVAKTEVWVQLVGNKGTVFVEEGPLYCENAHEILHAQQELKERMLKILPGIDGETNYEYT